LGCTRRPPPAGLGGTLKPAVDHCICIPSDSTARIQECHIVIGHIIAQLVEATLYNIMPVGMAQITQLRYLR